MSVFILVKFALVGRITVSCSRVRVKSELIDTGNSTEEHVGYRSGARKVHRTSKDYLEYLDGKLGFSQGTLYNLCMRAVKSRAETRDGVTVTYRGLTEGQRRLTHRFVPVSKGVFLIEFKATKAGKQYNKVVQVHLEM